MDGLELLELVEELGVVYHRWRLDEGAVTQLGNQGQHVIDSSCLDAICRAITVEQPMRREDPKSSFIWLVEIRQLIQKPLQCEKADILAQSHEESFVRMVRFRNRAVHLYDQIGAPEVIDILEHHLGAVELFIGAMAERYLVPPSD